VDLCTFNPAGIWKTANYYCLFNDILGSWVPDKWYINYQKRHAAILYSDLNEYGGIDTDDGVISVLAPTDETLTSSYFDPDNITLNGTILNSIGAGINDIGLESVSKIIALVVDESGSMTWRDENGFRHTLLELYIDKLSGSYIPDVKYKVFKFGGKTVHVNISSDLFENSPFQPVDSFFSQYLFNDDINNFAGIRIVRRDDGFPANPIDGDILFDGIVSNYHDTGLVGGKTYYYSIYTFDENYRFSEGVRISARPNSSIVEYWPAGYWPTGYWPIGYWKIDTLTILPRGVKTFSTEVLNGSGIIVDDNVSAVWHFDEGRSDVVYDFNANVDLSVSESNPIWLNESDVPVGTSGLRFNGETTSVSTESSTSRLSMSSGGQTTLVASVYSFSLNSQTAIISRSSSDGLSVNYVLGIDGSNRRLSFQKGMGVADLVYSDSDVLTENTWHNVACVVDLESLTASFYVDAIPVGVSAFIDDITDNTDMIIDVGHSKVIPFYERFFGYITEVSIHNVARSYNYIIDQKNLSSTDNGDRLIVFKYSIPEIYNFNDHNVHVVKNDFREPSYFGDGDVIYSNDVSTPGEYYTTYREEFVLGSIYYFRAFSENGNNLCTLADSMKLSVDIGKIDDVNKEKLPVAGSLSQPYDLVSTSGDRKVHLSWSINILDENIKKIRIYRSESGFPVINEDGRTDEELVYECDPIDTTYYVDRLLANNVQYYYSIVSVGRYQNISVASYIGGMAEEGLDESTIPLVDIKNIGYEIGKTDINLFWDDVVQTKNLTTYFGKDVVLYMKITDDYGNTLDIDDYEITTEVSSSYTRPIGVAEDVFLDNEVTEGNLNSPLSESLYSLTVTNIKDGLSKGLLRLTGDSSLLSNIDTVQVNLRFTISLTNSSGTVFQYKSLPILVTWKNPLDFNIENKNQTYVKINRKKKINVLDNQIPSTETKYDGSYVNSSTPYTARVYLYSEGSAAKTVSNVIA